MVLAFLAACLCAPAPSAGPGSAGLAPGAVAPAGAEGEITWFDGSYRELLRRAQEEKKLVLLEFRAKWCSWCRRLEQETFREPRVIAALDELLCFSIDTGTGEGAALARSYHEPGLPALIFLEPDGQIRDVLFGFHEADELLAEVDRIRRNEGTLSALRARIAETPDDVDLRYELALKLDSIGDEDGYRAEIEAIRKLDPDLRSYPMRKVALDDILASLKKELLLDPLYRFLDEERDERLLFRGWYAVWQFEDYLCRRATWEDELEQAGKHARSWVQAARNLWRYTPKERYGRLGNTIAWLLYENRERLDEETKLFALEVARQAVEANGEAAVVDTLACCLHMNGKEEEALAAVERCLELEPDNIQWRRRLEEFTR